MLYLSSILLFALVLPPILTYRLSPGDTPFWFFGLLFALLLGNFGLDLFGQPGLKLCRLKNRLTWLIVFLVVGSLTWSSILVRHRTAPGYQIHDIILQQEAALNFLLNGQNPYATSYFGTHLESWHYSDTEVNPALYYLVMMPGYFLLALPFRLLSVPLLGFFDGRLPLVFLFWVMLAVAWQIPRRAELKRQLVVLLALNPANFGYFLEGRSDIFMFAFLLGSLWLLRQKKWLGAGVLLGTALAVKQSAWPILPFFTAYLWLTVNQKDRLKKMRILALRLLPLAVSFGVLVLPFVWWDFRAFWQSTVGYLSGSVEHSYPVSGYGWGMILKNAGVIGDPRAYYPFWRWQLAVGLPVLAILLLWLKNKPSVFRLTTAYGLFTFVFWYFSRYFNNSHLAYLSLVMITAYYLQDSPVRRPVN